MQFFVEGRSLGKRVCGVEMLSGPEDARGALAKADFHLALEDEHPLRLWRAMPCAAEAGRALSQLVAGRREDGGKRRLRGPVGKRHRFLPPAGTTVAIRIEDDL